jgi:hypothetical protein
MAKSPPKQQPTAEERALKEVSAAQWNDYQQRFRPAEIAMAKNAELTDGERAQVKGEVAADTAQAFEGLTRSTISAGEQSGADVNSGKTKLSLAANATAAGQARGVGQSIAETGAELDEQGQMLRIAGFGREVAAGATADMSRGARRATGLALAASQAKFERNQARIAAVSAVAGAATNKFLKVRKANKEAEAAYEKSRKGLGLDAGNFDKQFADMASKNSPFKNVTNPFAGLFNPDLDL